MVQSSAHPPTPMGNFSVGRLPPLLVWSLFFREAPCRVRVSPLYLLKEQRWVERGSLLLSGCTPFCFPQDGELSWGLLGPFHFWQGGGFSGPRWASGGISQHRNLMFLPISGAGYSPPLSQKEKSFEPKWLRLRHTLHAVTCTCR